jgi:DNA end-binding protein Ku
MGHSVPMARALWSGTLTFGLVTIPVKLYPAVSRKTVRFHQLDGENLARIQQRRVNSTTGEEVPYERLVKGYEVTPDRYVVIKPEELDSLDPKKTRTIEIEDFVDESQIDPILYDSTYYVAPATGGAKPYRLLLDAMTETGRVGIARFVMRTKEYLVALRPSGDTLELSTMIFADEVVDPGSLEELQAAKEAEATKRELDVAKQLIGSLQADFDPSGYRDDYRERVLDLVERKAQGEQIEVVAEPEPESSPVPDLMSALKASLDAVRADQPSSEGNGGAVKPKAAPKKPAAKKPAAKQKAARAKAAAPKKPAAKKTAAKSSPAKQGSRRS